MPDSEFAELCRTGTAEQIRQALKDGANPDAEDEEGNVPALALAISDNKDSGAAIDAQDNFGVSALMAAAASGHPAVVAELLRAGADKNLEDAGENEEETPHDALWYAKNPGDEVSREDAAACVRLLEGGAGR